MINKVVSVFLGVALALLFQRICKDRKCVVIKVPTVDEITSKTHQYEDDCFRFKQVPTACPDDNSVEVVKAFD